MDNLARAANLLGAVMDPLHDHAAAIARLGLSAVPGAAHLAAARRVAAAQLAPLAPADRQATYDAAMDLLINREQNATRFTRQILCNGGMPRTMDVLEPAAESSDAKLLAALDAEAQRTAAATYATWRQALPEQLDEAQAHQRREAAERACHSAFGLGDPRTLELLLASLAAAVAAEDGASARRRLVHLPGCTTKLQGDQVDVLLATWTLACRMVSETWDPDEREDEAAPWLRLYAWASHRVSHAEADGGPQAARTRQAALARLQRKLKLLAADPLLAANPRTHGLADQVDEMLERLRGQGPGAEQMRRRAFAKMTEWTQGTQDSQRAAEVWLEKWLALASGYPCAELSSPLPAFDRGTTGSMPRQRLPAEEVNRRLALFAEVFSRRVVGNVRLFCALQAYLRAALTQGEQPIVMLHGEAGTGKSAIAEIVAETVFPQLHFHSKNISGAQTASAILGVSPTYHGSEYSLFAEGLAQRRGSNVFFFVDEVDHTSAEVQDALATALDFNDKAPFYDGYLQVPLNLHGDPMVFACNDTEQLQKQLISRFRKGLVAKAEVLDAHDRQEVIWRQYVATLKSHGKAPPQGDAGADLLPFSATQNVFAPSFFARLEADHKDEQGLRALLSTVQKIAHMSQLSPDPASWNYPLRERHVALACYQDWITVDWQSPKRNTKDEYHLFNYELGLFCNDTTRTDQAYVLRFSDPHVADLGYQIEITSNTVRCSSGPHADERKRVHDVVFYDATLIHPYPQTWPTDHGRGSQGATAAFASARNNFFADQEGAVPVVLLPKQRLFVLRGWGFRRTALSVL